MQEIHSRIHRTPQMNHIILASAIHFNLTAKRYAAIQYSYSDTSANE